MPIWFPGRLVAPSATSSHDFGGGYRMGMLLRSVDPRLLDGSHAGLVTSRFRPFTWDGGRGRLSVYGHLNKAWVNVDNGNPADDNHYLSTNSADPNLIGARARYHIFNDLSISARVALTASLHNTSLQNDFSDAGCDSRERDKTACLYDAGVDLKSPTLGKISLGLGETASNGIGAINLGGTAFVTNNNPAVKVGEHEVWGTGWRFADIAPDVMGVTRGTRIRYDSPTLAGFSVSASWGEESHVGAPSDAEGEYWDAALRYAGEFSSLRIAAGVSYQDYNRQGTDLSQSNLTGGLSIMHVPTGLYISGSATGINRSAPGMLGAGETDSASAYYLQGGISQNFFGIGRTTIYGEYGKTNSGANAGAHFVDDSATTNWGLGLVQNIDSTATSLYVTYNRVGAEVNGTKGQDIDVILAGARVKF